jgi:hypothetical protein
MDSQLTHRNNSKMATLREVSLYDEILFTSIFLRVTVYLLRGLHMFVID